MSEMNNDRRTEDLLAAIDHELKAALSVAPSADFEARVLRTIEERAEARRSWWMPSYAFLAAAAAVVITTTIAIVMLKPAADEQAPVARGAGRDVHLAADATVRLKADTTPEVRLKADTTSAVRRKADSTPVRPKAPTTSGPSSVVSAFRRTPQPAGEPEVLVPLNQLAAVRRLVRDVNEGRISEIPSEPAPAAGEPAEVAVAPLIVEPISVPAVEARGGISPAVRGL
jgi:hypothetical protein